MNTNIEITFQVTPTQNTTMLQRAKENGFDTLSAYVKVASLLSTKYQVSPTESIGDGLLDISFTVTPEQKKVMQRKAKECGTDDLITYIKFISLNAVVNVNVEVRSSGNFEDMLKRIAGKKSK